MIRNMIFFNCLEPFLLILLLLNSIVYPNFGTALYLIFALSLTGLCLSKEEKKINLKQIFAIVILISSVAILITKAVFIVDLHKQGELNLDETDILMYRTCGIYIHLTTNKIGIINVFMSIFFDIMEFILCILVVILYGSQRKDIR